jgi:nitronate monooxygenase
MGGADGVWVGTRFLAAWESLLSDGIVQRVLGGQETSTILTRLFDRAMQAPWPEQYPGRVLANAFTHDWQDTPLTDAALTRLQNGLARNDPEVIPAYAGESVQFVTQRENAADIATTLMTEAAQWWMMRAQGIAG